MIVIFMRIYHGYTDRSMNDKIRLISTKSGSFFSTNGMEQKNMEAVLFGRKQNRKKNNNRQYFDKE